VALCRDLKAPVHLDQSGSDCCEILFSSLGGCGKIQHSRRNYDFDGVLEMVGDQNTLELFRADPDPATKLKFRRHTKTEHFLADDEPGSDVASLEVFPSDEEMIAT
jgi:hypothetical protein